MRYQLNKYQKMLIYPVSIKFHVGPVSLRFVYYYFTNLEPLVDALGVELVAAGQHPQGLPHLEITHAHHAHSLVVLAAVARVPATRLNEMKM